MRSSTPSGAPSGATSPYEHHFSQQTPSIRLISAIPLAVGMSSDGNSSYSNTPESSWASVTPSMIAPKPDAPVRKRLVPKKSKLGLLGVGPKDRGKDFSGSPGPTSADVSSLREGFEIYVDPTPDPDLGDIVMIKKQKSRGALNEMRWGALGEVTNISNAPRAPPSASVMLKVKEEDKKWWSIGRGRKDSKEKEKEGKENAKRAKSPDVPMRSKTPEPFKLNQDSRARFNSLDSGVLLNKPPVAGFINPKASSASDPEQPSRFLQPRSFTPESLKEACRASSPAPTSSRSATPTPTLGGFLAPPNLASNAKEQGSIALRAIRSVRSLARMGSWIQTGVDENIAKDATITEKRDKKEKKDKKQRKDKKEHRDKENQNSTVREKKDKKEKSVKKEKRFKEGDDTPRHSISSFEAGSLTASPAPSKKLSSHTLGKKKSSILGLGIGLPSSMRLRSGSTASSVLQPNHLSVEGFGTSAKARMGSTISTASSLRPLSITSSSGASATTRESRGSVKWDEVCLQSRKREIQKEKKEKRKKKDKEAEEGEGSKRSVEGRRRVAITDIFPEVASGHGQDDLSANRDEEVHKRFSTAFPIVTIEEATVDGHGDDSEEIRSEEIHDSLVYGGILKEGENREEQDQLTPVKRHRVRPLSEQLLGKARPRAVYEDEEGVLSILDAATNDLAQLINNLDLEATPTTPDLTPLRPSPLPADILDSVRPRPVNDGSPLKRPRPGNDSPLKNKSPSTVSDTPRGLGPRTSTASITSLRPYAQSRGQATRTLTTPVFSSSSVNDATMKKKASQAGIGQQIAPWSVLMQQLSPVKENKPVKGSDKENDASKGSPSKTGTWKKGHRRTITPGPEPEPAPVFHPLQPPKARSVKIPDAFDGKGTLKTSAPVFTASADPPSAKGSVSPPASLARRASAFLRKRCSFLPIPADISTGDLSFACAGDNSLSVSEPNSNGTASPPGPATSKSPPGEKRRRMPGTLGGSDVSCYAVPELDASDPDSDIPDELQFILKNNIDRSDDDETFDFNKRFDRQHDDDEVEHPRSLPPLEFSPMPSETMDVSIFGTPFASYDGIDTGLDDSEHMDVEYDAEADTKKSFDFTGELRKLGESGASDRRSFVEQLERAFKTPAKVDLRYDFGRLLRVEVPPVPTLPVDLNLSNVSSNTSADASASSEIEGMNSAERSIMLEAHAQQKFKFGSEKEDQEPAAFDIYGMSRLVDVTKPTLFKMQSIITDETTAASPSISQVNLHGVSRPANIHQPTAIPDLSFGGSSIGRPDRVIVSADPSLATNTSFSSSISSRSCSSNGELNTSFRFGGVRRRERSEHSQEPKKPLTLSDIIPPPSHTRSISSSSSSSLLEDDSLFQSILAKVSDCPQPRPRVAPEVNNNYLQARKSTYRNSQASSIASFTGFDSFEEVRRGFEFNLHRPAFYPPPVPNNRRNNRVRESVMSIASVSSYGRLINPGDPDPFDFGLPSLQERPSSENLSTMSFSVDDTFSFLNHASRRKRVDSDASSFYFHPSHHRHSSNFSSQVPPAGFHNRSSGVHRRNDSNASTASQSAWRSSHRFNNSVDSILSDFSAMRLGRPGLGDKMFEMADQTMPLASISASSPDNSASGLFSTSMMQQPTYDSIMDDDRRPSLDASDSIFDKTGHRTSVLSEDSVFGYDDDSRIQPGLLPPHQFRPLSMMSMSSAHNPTGDDDTMITMLGGGHVRRCSMGSTMEASPCARVGKRKLQTYKGRHHDYQSPKKAKTVETLPVAASFQLGSSRVVQPQKAETGKHDPEDSYFVGHGEDVSVSFRSGPVFTRPPPASRSRSSTCTSSSGGETPPLLASDASSVSGSSMSSLDLREIDAMLSNSSFPTSTLPHARARARARGHGHRRRYSHIRSSRANSVYETIEEEAPSALTSPSRSPNTEKLGSSTQSPPVFIVGSDTDSIHSNIEDSMTWDDEKGIVALRRYYALHDEVQNAVTESKRMWSDTPFSLFAVQSFQPPHHPEGMKALLEHSVKTYGPLPSELRLRRARSRKDSRPSPYPQNRPPKVANSPDATHSSPRTTDSFVQRPFAAPTFGQALMTQNPNIPPVPSLLNSTKPFSFALNVEKDQIEVKNSNVSGPIRPRVASGARRSALGWSKRSTGPNGSAVLGAGVKFGTGTSTMSTKQKENVIGNENTMISGDNLRINRPRPKGRPTPSSTTRKAQRPIRV